MTWTDLAPSGLHVPDDTAGLVWGWRTVHPDMSSRRNFVWPLPGNWAVSDHNICAGNRSQCPRRPGDGLCVAKTWNGSAQGGIPAGTILIVAVRPDDILGEDEIKLRARRVWVGGVTSATSVLSHAPGADLYGANLAGADLAEANLTRANLTRADLYGANLTRANLAGADLTRADLTRANLAEADLTRANLYGANLAEANLARADLYGANLAGADLARANLAGADLAEANLTRANLTRADLTRANLTGATWSDSTRWPDGWEPPR